MDSDDEDLGDLYRSWREHKKEKKQSNLEWSTNYLSEQGIPFDSKNDGSHLIINSSMGKIDFWPSTGLFIRRSDERQGRGVKTLVKLVK